MQTLEIKGYDKKFFQGFQYDGVEIGIFSTEDVLGQCTFYDEHGAAYMGVVGDQLIGVGGVMPIRKGLGHAWAFINKTARGYALEWIPYMLDLQKKLADHYQLHRIESPVLAKSAGAIKLMRYLGYQREGTMRSYGPNKEDFYLYARIF